MRLIVPITTKLMGGYLFYSVWPSVCLSRIPCVLCNSHSSECVAHSDLWPCHIFSRSFSHDFAIELLKYSTSCRAACTDLDRFFPYMAQMITSMRGCIACNEHWWWPISSRLFTCDIAYFMDYINMCHKYNPWGNDVSHAVSKSIGQRSRSHGLFKFLRSGWEYPGRSLSYNFWFVSRTLWPLYVEQKILDN